MPLFTSENARELGQRGAKERWAKAKAREAEEQEAARVSRIVATPDGFTGQIITRTREHIVRLSDMIAAERDAMKLDRLASALSRLSELERVLSGRPLPGSFKPVAPKVRKVAVMNYSPGAEIETVNDEAQEGKVDAGPFA